MANKRRQNKFNTLLEENRFSFSELQPEEQSELKEALRESNFRGTLASAAFLLFLQLVNVAVLPGRELTGFLRTACYSGVALLSLNCMVMLIGAFFRRAAGAFSGKMGWYHRNAVGIFWAVFIIGIQPFIWQDIIIRNSLGNWGLLIVLMMIIPHFNPLQSAISLGAALALLGGAFIVQGGDQGLFAQAVLLSLAAFVVSCRNYVSFCKGLISSRRLREANEAQRRANTQLAQLAEHDPLTNLLNRRGLERRTELLWALCQRNRQEITTFFLDIDYFKAYNDEFGHVIGDECLRRVAGCIETVVRRETDIVARYGGEEFLVAFNGGSKQDILALAQKICREVRELKIPAAKRAVESINPYVTVSLGIANELPSQGSSFEQLCKKADEAAYKAKQNGRNCLVWGEKVYKD